MIMWWGRRTAFPGIWSFTPFCRGIFHKLAYTTAISESWVRLLIPQLSSHTRWSYQRNQNSPQTPAWYLPHHRPLSSVLHLPPSVQSSAVYWHPLDIYAWRYAIPCHVDRSWLWLHWRSIVCQRSPLGRWGLCVWEPPKTGILTEYIVEFPKRKVYQAWSEALGTKSSPAEMSNKSLDCHPQDVSFLRIYPKLN